MHAGYITDNINGTEHYSLVMWNGSEIIREMRQLDGETTLNRISRLSMNSGSKFVNKKTEEKEEEKEDKPEQQPETNESTKKPEGSWVKDGSEWRYRTAEGKYAANGWKLIDGKWYYFDAEGIMEHNAYRRGYYLTPGGAWDGKPAVTGWKKNKTGWWYSLDGNDYLKNTWKKIDGSWYYFNEEGYAARNEFISGWWIGDDYTQTNPTRYTWHKNNKGWWYGVKNVWYAKNRSYNIDGMEYRFDGGGYWMP